MHIFILVLYNHRYVYYVFFIFLQKVVIYYNIQYLSNLDPYLEVFSFEKMCISETKVGE